MTTDTFRRAQRAYDRQEAPWADFDEVAEASGTLELACLCDLDCPRQDTVQDEINALSLDDARASMVRADPHCPGCARRLAPVRYVTERGELTAEEVA